MLEATVHLFHGKTEVKIQAEDSKTMIQQLAFFTAIPQQCDICGAHLHFSFRNPDPKVKYWGVECEGQIKHTLNFGVHSEEEKGLFVKDEYEYFDKEAHEYRKIRARDVKEASSVQVTESNPKPQTTDPVPSTPRVANSSTLNKDRAENMQAELEKLGYPKREQLRLASSVLEKPVRELASLSETEALEVWSYAKRVARQSAA